VDAQPVAEIGDDERPQHLLAADEDDGAIRVAAQEIKDRRHSDLGTVVTAHAIHSDGYCHNEKGRVRFTHPAA
jgi:hypothetical protein